MEKDKRMKDLSCYLQHYPLRLGCMRLVGKVVWGKGLSFWVMRGAFEIFLSRKTAKEKVLKIARYLKRFLFSMTPVISISIRI